MISDCRIEADFCGHSEDTTITKVRRDTDNGESIEISNSTRSVEQNSNRGPLATIALALFGTNSFIADRMNHPSIFLYPNRTYDASYTDYIPYACVGQAPLIGLLGGGGSNNNILNPCLGNNIHDHDDVQRQLMDFVRALYYSNHDQYDLSDSSTITNAFTAAAFLANQAWLQSLGPYDQTWQVTYDMGADTIIPVISDAGIAIVSLLLGVFLTCLLSLAVYSARVPRWTDQLDAFAILRLGAGFADEVRSQKVDNPDHDGVLDALPGHIRGV